MASSPRIIRQLDHVAIRVNDPGPLFALLTDTFQLPIVWPLKRFDFFVSGGVAAGNLHLEIIRFGSHPDPTLPADRAVLSGLAFEPEPLAVALRELARRGIPHGPPIPYFEKHPGGRQHLWTNCVLGGLLQGSYQPLSLGRWLGGNSLVNRLLGRLLGRLTELPALEPVLASAFRQTMFYLVEYTGNIDQFRRAGRAELQARNGGPLGLEAVREVVLGVGHFQQTEARWQRLLEPLAPLAPGLWQLGDGPALRLLPVKTDSLRSLVWQVASLPKARDFLHRQGLLGAESEQRLTLALDAVAGLFIELTESTPP